MRGLNIWPYMQFIHASPSQDFIFYVVMCLNHVLYFVLCQGENQGQSLNAFEKQCAFNSCDIKFVKALSCIIWTIKGYNPITSKVNKLEMWTQLFLLIMQGFKIRTLGFMSSRLSFLHTCLEESCSTTCPNRLKIPNICYRSSSSSYTLLILHSYTPFWQHLGVSFSLCQDLFYLFQFRVYGTREVESGEHSQGNKYLRHARNNMLQNRQIANGSTQVALYPLKL